jgi:DNA-directed RNA polymerase sigma subunit (sigma70/sigma32)
MNLKNCKGKVPVFVGGDAPYKLVDFPTREQFDELYKRNNKILRDKYWGVLKMRSEGHTLLAVGGVHTLTRERIRQIEAKFLRKVAVSLETEKP